MSGLGRFIRLFSRPAGDKLKQDLIDETRALTDAWDESRTSRLDLSRTATTDAELRHLELLNGLNTLVLSHTSITDSGLHILASLTHLVSVDLRGTDITDEGLKHLLHLPMLPLYLK